MQSDLKWTRKDAQYICLFNFSLSINDKQSNLVFAPLTKPPPTYLKKFILSAFQIHAIEICAFPLFICSSVEISFLAELGTLHKDEKDLG